jgi:hypothetical protein
MLRQGLNQGSRAESTRVLKGSSAQQYYRANSSASTAVGDKGAYRSDGPGLEIVRAETMNGAKVVNLVGEDLGKIEGIMVDVMAGRIAYAVSSFGGSQGAGDKLFAIPWCALTHDAAQQCFVLELPKERLENAPSFAKSHWPTMSDRIWASEVHAYYNVLPYWNDQLKTGDLLVAIFTADQPCG